MKLVGIPFGSFASFRMAGLQFTVILNEVKDLYVSSMNNNGKDKSGIISFTPSGERDRSLFIQIIAFCARFVIYSESVGATSPALSGGFRANAFQQNGKERLT